MAMQRAVSCTARRCVGENSNDRVSSLSTSAARAWIRRGEWTPCLTAFTLPGCEATSVSGLPRLFIPNMISVDESWLQQSLEAAFFTNDEIAGISGLHPQN